MIFAHLFAIYCATISKLEDTKQYTGYDTQLSGTYLGTLAAVFSILRATIAIGLDHWSLTGGAATMATSRGRSGRGKEAAKHLLKCLASNWIHTYRQGAAFAEFRC
jgi:hypothetical protein